MEYLHPATRFLIVLLGLVLAAAVATAVMNDNETTSQSASLPTATAEGRQGRKRRMREKEGEQKAIEASIDAHEPTEDNNQTSDEIQLRDNALEKEDFRM